MRLLMRFIPELVVAAKKAGMDELMMEYQTKDQLRLHAFKT